MAPGGSALALATTCGLARHQLLSTRFVICSHQAWSLQEDVAGLQAPTTLSGHSTSRESQDLSHLIREAPLEQPAIRGMFDACRPQTTLSGQCPGRSMPPTELLEQRPSGGCLKIKPPYPVSAKGLRAPERPQESQARLHPTQCTSRGQVQLCDTNDQQTSADTHDKQGPGQLRPCRIIIPARLS